MIFLSTVMVILKWPPPVSTKAICIYCNYTASEVAIGSGMDWGLFMTFVLSTSTTNCVHSDSQLPWSCW
jgi:hypothetical protein